MPASLSPAPEPQDLASDVLGGDSSIQNPARVLALSKTPLQWFGELETTLGGLGLLQTMPESDGAGGFNEANLAKIHVDFIRGKLIVFSSLPPEQQQARMSGVYQNAVALSRLFPDQAGVFKEQRNPAYIIAHSACSQFLLMLAWYCQPQEA